MGLLKKPTEGACKISLPLKGLLKKSDKGGLAVVGTTLRGCPSSGQARRPVPTKPSRLRRVNLLAADPETGFFNNPDKGGRGGCLYEASLSRGSLLLSQGLFQQPLLGKAPSGQAQRAVPTKTQSSFSSGIESRKGSDSSLGERTRPEGVEIFAFARHSGVCRNPFSSRMIILRLFISPSLARIDQKTRNKGKTNGFRRTLPYWSAPTPE